MKKIFKMTFLKNYSIGIFVSWKHDIDDKTLSLLERNQNAAIVDIGCGDGAMTTQFAKKIGSLKTVVGLESIPNLVKKANKNGIDCKVADLEKKFPLQSKSFDVVISYFSLEHVLNVDNFVSEIYRILKSGGYALIATDNLSSWANIAVLTLGYHPFSLTPGLSDIVLGNPFAIRSSESGISWAELKDVSSESDVPAGTYGHIRVLAYQALKDLLIYKKFRVESISGAGYLFLEES